MFCTCCNQGVKTVGMRLQQLEWLCKQCHGSACCACRGLFATHYHRLADAHEQDPKVAICHMGCSVEPGTNGEPEQVLPLFTHLLQFATHYAALLLLEGRNLPRTMLLW